MYALTVNDIDAQKTLRGGSVLSSLRFSTFRKAIRNGTVNAQDARRIFRKNFAKLSEICRREGCSIEKARTISAALEGEVNAALLRAGQPVKGTCVSVVDLLKDLKS